MNNQMTETSDFAARSKKNTIRLGLWTGAWVLATALVAFGPKLLWDFDTSLTILALLSNLGIGVGMILANKQHLKGLDEMHQKIQLEAMGLSLGIGLVVGIGYEQMEDIRLITFEPEISHLIMLMAISYMIGVFLGTRRYR